MNTKLIVAAALVVLGVGLLAVTFATPGQPLVFFGLSTASGLWRPIEGVLMLSIGIVMLVTGPRKLRGCKTCEANNPLRDRS